jgi:predicted Zn-dependent protease
MSALAAMGTSSGSLANSDDSPILLTREQSLAIAQQLIGVMTARDATLVVNSSVSANTEFARSEIVHGYQVSGRNVGFFEEFDRRHCRVNTNQVDDASLRALVSKAEALAQSLRVLARVEQPGDKGDSLEAPGPVNPLLWADDSQALFATEGRLAAIDASLGAMQQAGVFGAGLIGSDPRTSAVLNKAGHFEYGRYSTCNYSLTARTPDGTGSGWAYWEGEDWSKCDVTAMTARAIDLARRSRNPVAVEPGRWTVVMTPDACGALVRLIATAFQGFELIGGVVDGGGWIFSKPGGGNKIGLKVMDERVTLSVDPMDPEGGFLPFAYVGGNIVQQGPVTWVERGVLTTLSYGTRAEAAQHGLAQANNAQRLRMAGGPTSIEEMIATTERGIFVNRFSDVDALSQKTLFSTGVTRDGTFLIEKGKITKPIKNMRFEDSPMFFLNNLEAIGPARRVEAGNVMPAIKVRDFAFTSLTDAV